MIFLECQDEEQKLDVDSEPMTEAARRRHSAVDVLSEEKVRHQDELGPQSVQKTNRFGRLGTLHDSLGRYQSRNVLMSPEALKSKSRVLIKSQSLANQSEGQSGFESVLHNHSQQKAKLGATRFSVASSRSGIFDPVAMKNPSSLVFAGLQTFSEYSESSRNMGLFDC